MTQRVILLLVALFFLAGCGTPARKPPRRPVPPPPVVKPAPPVVKPLPPPVSPDIIPPTAIPKPGAPLTRLSDEQLPRFADDMDPASLDRAIEKSLQYYRRAAAKAPVRMGDRVVSTDELRDSLIALREILLSGEPDEVKQERIREGFDVYQSVGSDGKNAVLFTGYFESMMKGALEPSREFRYPIYGVPDDAITVNLGKFFPKYQSDQVVGRLKNRELVPYYSRSEIDGQQVLSGRSLEIAWVADPVDLFFLHTQGSGKIQLPDGSLLQIGYALKNGRPFVSLGTYLLRTGRITPQEMSYREIKRYLKQQPPEELFEILGRNESYIFFRVVKEGPVGAIEEILTPGRSIATDPDLFPKGAPAFIKTRKPVLDAEGRVESWIPYSRFVLSQDVGGAIKGAGRVDLFCGSGGEAEMVAGSLKERGELFFLVKKRPDSAADQRNARK